MNARSFIVSTVVIATLIVAGGIFAQVGVDGGPWDNLFLNEGYAQDACINVDDDSGDYSLCFNTTDNRWVLGGLKATDTIDVDNNSASSLQLNVSGSSSGTQDFSLGNALASFLRRYDSSSDTITAYTGAAIPFLGTGGTAYEVIDSSGNIEFQVNADVLGMTTAVGDLTVGDGTDTTHTVTFDRSTADCNLTYDGTDLESDCDTKVTGAFDVTGVTTLADDATAESDLTIDGDTHGARLLLLYGRPSDLTGTNLLRPAGNVPWINYQNGYVQPRSGQIVGWGLQTQVSSCSCTSLDVTMRIYVDNSIVWSPSILTGLSAAEFTPGNHYGSVTRANAVSNGYTFSAGDPIGIKIEFGGTYSAATLTRTSLVLEVVYDD